MFNNRHSYRRKSRLNQFAAIASIISAALLCIKLSWVGIISIGVAAMIMIAVVIMAAIGNTATKLGLSAIAVFLFAKYLSNGSEAEFQGIVGAILALFIALLGLYIMLKGIFSSKR